MSAVRCLGSAGFPDIPGQRALKLFQDRIGRTAARAKTFPQLAGYGIELEHAGARCSFAVASSNQRRKDQGARAALSEAHYVMELFGLTSFAWIWLDMALASVRHVDHADAETLDFHLGKLQTCRYVFFHRLVETEKLIDIIVRPDASVSGMRDEWF